jgi:hypothetical protein
VVIDVKVKYPKEKPIFFSQNGPWILSCSKMRSVEKGFGPPSKGEQAKNLYIRS